MFRPYTAECQHDLEVRCEHDYCGVAAPYQPNQLKHFEKPKKFENIGHKFNKNYKLTVITYKSIKDMNPLFQNCLKRNQCL